MEHVLTRNKQPAPGAQAVCSAAGRAGSSPVFPAVWAGVGRACARAAGGSWRSLGMSYKPSCSKTVFCISQKSLAAGSEHWTLASAQTPLQHCGLGVCPISVLIQRGNWYLQKQHTLQLFKLLKFLLWHHRAEAEMKLPQLNTFRLTWGSLPR